MSVEYCKVESCVSGAGVSVSCASVTFRHMGVSVLLKISMLMSLCVCVSE